MTSSRIPPQPAPGPAQPYPTLPGQPLPGQPPPHPAFHGEAGPSAYVDRGAGARRIAGWVTLAGAVLVAAGSFLPWAHVLLAGPVYGTDGDGVITLGAAVPVVLLGLVAGLGKGRAWMFAIALFLGLLATAVGAYDLSNISALVSGESMADLGPGLPVIVVGGLVVLAGSFFGLLRGRRGRGGR